MAVAKSTRWRLEDSGKVPGQQDEQTGLLRELRPDLASGVLPFGIILTRRPERPSVGSVPPRREASSGLVGRIALTQAEACEALGCSEEWFSEHVRPYLAVLHGGRKRLYAVAELERFMAMHAEAVLNGR